MAVLWQYDSIIVVLCQYYGCGMIGLRYYYQIIMEVLWQYLGKIMVKLRPYNSTTVVLWQCGQGCSVARLCTDLSILSFCHRRHVAVLCMLYKVNSDLNHCLFCESPSVINQSSKHSSCRHSSSI